MNDKSRVKQRGMGQSNMHKPKVKSKEGNESNGIVTNFKSLDDIPDMDENAWCDYAISPTKAYQKVGYKADFAQNNFSDNNEDEDYYSHKTTNKGNYNYDKDDEEESCQNNNYRSQQQRITSDINTKYSKPSVSFTNNKNNNKNNTDFDSDDSDEYEPEPQLQNYDDYPTSYTNHNKTSNNNNNNNNTIKMTKPVKPAPPLPCEKEVENIPEKDKLYFSKQPRSVEYKPYTQGQYNLIRPKEYVEISNFKPDLNTDELVAKRANLDRIKEFSKNLKSFNEENLKQQRKLPSSVEKADMVVSKQKQESKRHKALEFARNIPKPKSNKQSNIKKQLYEDDEDDNGELVDNFQMDSGKDYEEDMKLRELEAKHLNSKKQIEMIKKSMGY